MKSYMKNIYDIFVNFFHYLMQLATEMLRLFDPTLDQQTAPPEESLNLIPIYRNPKIQGGILPGTSVLSVLFGEDALNRNSISVTVHFLLVHCIKCINVVSNT